MWDHGPVAATTTTMRMPNATRAGTAARIPDPERCPPLAGPSADPVPAGPEPAGTVPAGPPPAGPAPAGPVLAGPVLAGPGPADPAPAAVVPTATVSATIGTPP